jgi:hypothetical protein
MRIFSLAVATLLAGPALAADLPAAYKAPLLSPGPVVSWSGVYVGGTLSASWRFLDAQVTN